MEGNDIEEGYRVPVKFRSGNDYRKLWYFFFPLVYWN